MQRTTGAGNISGMFVHEDPAIDQPPTEITAAWLNAVQEELVTIVHGANMVLNPANNGQVFSAISALIAAATAGGPVTEDSKWAQMPIGHAQPFIPAVMGTSITAWLSAHPSWRKLDNNYVPDIEGRAMAIASGSHIAGSQSGSDDAVNIDHGHSTSNPPHTHTANATTHGHTANATTHNHSGNDPGHSHGVTDPGHDHSITTKANLGGLAGGASLWNGELGINTAADTTGISINAATTGITLNDASVTASINDASVTASINATATAITVWNSGVSGTDKNIQRTQYLEWIIKIS